MQGYDIEQATKSITANIDRKLYPEFSNQFDALVRRAIELDLQYMHESGALDADGFAGNAYYDDDEAFEYILDGITRERGWGEEKSLRLGGLIDDYMDAQQSYMESIGMLDWD